jgi:hypothetical protein
MSWSFRKIFRFGPFRTTVSKNGLGLSFGIPGFRVGVSGNGKKYITLGIPGTGIYYRKFFDFHKSGQNEKQLINEPEQQSATVIKESDEPWWKQKHI